MKRLPYVKKEVGESMKQNLKSRSMKDRFTYIARFWLRLKDEQPELSKIILHEMNAINEKELQTGFAHGVSFLYMLLESQLEADELNETWGGEEDVPF